MAVVSSDVTFTLKTFAPAESATWWPSVVMFESASVISEPSSHSNVAFEFVRTGVTVSSLTVLGTTAV